MMETLSSHSQDQSSSVAALQAAYGAPSQSGFGSAVFQEPLFPEDKLEHAALAKYRYFVGELWDRYGEDAWMEPWREVYSRTPGERPDIVAELNAITDREAAVSTSMILGVDSAALSRVFDGDISELRVFNLGDGGAMYGLLVAGRWSTADEVTILVFLMD